MSIYARRDKTWDPSAARSFVPDRSTGYCRIAEDLLYVSRMLKNKHQAVSRGARDFGKRRLSIRCGHLQKPCNAESRSEALFCNRLSMFYSDGASLLMQLQRFLGRCLFLSVNLVQCEPEEDSQRQARQSKKDAEYWAHGGKFIHIQFPPPISLGFGSYPPNFR